MNENSLVSIAMHIGKAEFQPLLENLIKSFLVCNEYPNIELILIESGGNKDIRDWLESLDFDDFFVNFDGTKTHIKKSEKVKILKTLMFENFHLKYKGTICCEKSEHKAIQIAKGEYFVFFPEDCQFNIKGNIISDYIKILNHFDSDKTTVHFLTQQQYKYSKHNNRFIGPIKITNKINAYRPVEMKWDPFCFSKRSIYDQVGPMPESSFGIPHEPVEEYTRRFIEIGFKRIYPEIYIGIWMYNEHRDVIINKIKEKSKHDPDFIYYKIFNRDDIFDGIRNNNISSSFKHCNSNIFITRPTSTDDFIGYTNT